MKTALMVLGVLVLIASALMYYVGSTNGHLTELKDFYWTLIPLGVLLLAGGYMTKKK